MLDLERGMEVLANPDTPEGQALIEKLEMCGVGADEFLRVHSIGEMGEEEPLDPHGVNGLQITPSREIVVTLPIGCDSPTVMETALRLPPNS
jgi:hypothetical protein